MPKYRKKPVVIEAIQYTGDNLEEIVSFSGGVANGFPDSIGPNRMLRIRTLEGDHAGSVGDYIIRGVKGEYYPCKPDIFEATYDRVEDDAEEVVLAPTEDDGDWAEDGAEEDDEVAP
jgi:hypothetical protein